MSQRTRATLPPPAHNTAEQAAEPLLRNAATVVFNLSGYSVLEAVDRPLGGRRVVVTAQVREGA